MKPHAEATADLGEDRSEWPEVAIIVLNWNNYEDTAECLASLEQIEYPNYRVIVVDNGSSDGSGKRLQDEFKWCRFIFNEENLGFAGGNNVGIEHAKNRGIEQILLLNNDMVVKRNFLTPLVSVSEASDDIGIVSGVIRRMNSNRIWFAGGDFYPTVVKPTKRRYIKDKQAPYESEHVVGALMLLKTTLVQEVGTLDDGYFFGRHRPFLSCLEVRMANTHKTDVDGIS